MEYYNDQVTRDKLQQLRNDIVLNSLYIHDYENSFGIDPNAVSDFFDGYIEFLSEIEEEDYNNGVINDRPSFYDVGVFLDKYDTLDHLENWYDIVVGGGSPSFIL